MVKKIIYLTIDDAPSRDFKAKVDYLVSKNIPAIFFCRGDLIEKYPGEIEYAIKKGFIIGNHSYSHPHFSEISLEEAKEQIKRTDERIESAYKSANVKRLAKLFRFPYFDKGGKNKDALQEYLREQGYVSPVFENIEYAWFKDMQKDIDFGWTYDCEEWRLKKKYPGKIKTFEDVLQKMEEPNPELGGSLLDDSNQILIIHDHEETTKYFFIIIDKLLEKGFMFKLPRFG